MYSVKGHALHVLDATENDCNKVMIHTVDADVLVSAVSTIQQLSIDEPWITFATGKTFRYLQAHETATTLGPEKSLALPLQHAFTGCDMASSFTGCGKKTVWKIWKNDEDNTPAFVTLRSIPSCVDGQMDVLECFVIVLYDRTRDVEKINEARKLLFSQKGRPIDALPPKLAALLEHTK